jgi:hypothetical protein
MDIVDVLRSVGGWPDEVARQHFSCGEIADEIDRLRAEVASLKEENENLCTVMIAAAEEIHEFWDAHCDEEGYGPANLMHRLERGIPAEYGYKAGDFERMMKERDTLTQQLAAANEQVERQAQVIAEALHELDSSAIDWDSPVLRASQLLQAEVDAAISNFKETKK